MLYVHIYAKITEFYSIIANFDKVKRDHLVNFYISLEKRKKLLYYLCNSMTDLHKIEHDNAERVCEVHDC